MALLSSNPEGPPNLEGSRQLKAGSKVPPEIQAAFVSYARNKDDGNFIGYPRQRIIIPEHLAVFTPADGSYGAYTRQYFSYAPKNPADKHDFYDFALRTRLALGYVSTRKQLEPVQIIAEDESSKTPEGADFGKTQYISYERWYGEKGPDGEHPEVRGLSVVLDLANKGGLYLLYLEDGTLTAVSFNPVRNNGGFHPAEFMRHYSDQPLADEGVLHSFEPGITYKMETIGSLTEMKVFRAGEMIDKIEIPTNFSFEDFEGSLNLDPRILKDPLGAPPEADRSWKDKSPLTLMGIKWEHLGEQKKSSSGDWESLMERMKARDKAAGLKTDEEY